MGGNRQIAFTDPDQIALVEKLATDLRNRERIIIQGNSGAGKTTLMFSVLQRVQTVSAIHVDRNSEAHFRGGLPPGYRVIDIDSSRERLSKLPDLGAIDSFSVCELRMSEDAESLPRFAEEWLISYWARGAGGIVTIIGSDDKDVATKSLRNAYPRLCALATRYVYAKLVVRPDQHLFVEDDAVLSVVSDN